jgi:glycosyltransferase involved in cell wall biosynthesis
MRVALAEPEASNTLTGGYLWNARVMGALPAGATGAIWRIRAGDVSALGARVAAEEVDVIVLDSLWLLAPGEGTVARVRAARPGARVAWIVHALPSAIVTLGPPMPSVRERAALTAADIVVTTGRRLLAALADAEALPSAAAGAVCPPGVDPALVAAAARARGERLPQPAGAPLTVLTVATVAAHKGHDVLLEALARAGQPWRWRVVGDLGGAPGVVADLEARARALGVAANIDWVGPVAPAALGAEYGAADVFVLPSLSENAPLVLGEALACGLPVVATDVGDVPELVRDGVDGVIVRPGDALGLARAMALVLGDPGVRAQLAGHARTRKMPTWAGVAADFAGALAARTGPGTGPGAGPGAI